MALFNQKIEPPKFVNCLHEITPPSDTAIKDREHKAQEAIKKLGDKWAFRQKVEKAKNVSFGVLMDRLIESKQQLAEVTKE